MPRRAGEAPVLLGHHLGAQFGSRIAAQELNRDLVPNRFRCSLLNPGSAMVCASNLAKASPATQSGNRAARRRSMAYPGHCSKSSVLRFHFAQWTGRVPWVSLVLLHKRAASTLSQSALPARLQHRSASLLLVIALALVIPMERLFSSADSTLVQA